MAAPAYRSNSLATGAASGSITLTIPADVEVNDVLLLISVGETGNAVGTLDTPSESGQTWTDIDEQTAAKVAYSPSGRAQLSWRRVASTSERGATVTLSHTGWTSEGVSISLFQALLVAYSGCITSGDPWDDVDFAANVEQDFHYFTALTVSGSERTLVGLWCEGDNTAITSGPAGYTQRALSQISTSIDGSVGAWDKANVSSDGQVYIDGAWTTETGVTFHIALKPPTAGTPYTADTPGSAAVRVPRTGDTAGSAAVRLARSGDTDGSAAVRQARTGDIDGSATVALAGVADTPGSAAIRQARSGDTDGSATVRWQRTGDTPGSAGIATARSGDTLSSGTIRWARSGDTPGSAGIATAATADTSGSAAVRQPRTSDTPGAAAVLQARSSDTAGSATVSVPGSQTADTPGSATIRLGRSGDILSSAAIRQARTGDTPGSATVALAGVADTPGSASVRQARSGDTQGSATITGGADHYTADIPCSAAIIVVSFRPPHLTDASECPKCGLWHRVSEYRGYCSHGCLQADTAGNAALRRARDGHAVWTPGSDSHFDWEVEQ